ncbi:uncharacterized protein EV154DRAFT_575893 [Mucor mucedo]|uniref:uncharacterized protein n=1 Tax=Mucor mucedo TaxID=29922 RepID=UPI00221E555B|nr:uncharacterized protein EV154DRAFT_575893 [Mucor mucedo]KAI7894944.1 hypothetical protein EV154DRAFT_575893 [Mucor mucedo]
MIFSSPSYQLDRIRTIQDSTGNIGLGKKFKGKGKAVNTEVASTFSFQNMNESLNDAEADMEIESSSNITLDDSSDNFVKYIITKYDAGESSKADNTSNPVSWTVQSTDTSYSPSVPKAPHSSTTKVIVDQTEYIEKMNRTKMQRHLRLLREKTKPVIIKAAEVVLSKIESFSLKIKNYSDYIKERASFDILLREFYGNETYNTAQVYFPDSCFEFKVTNKGELYFGKLYVTRIRGYYPQPQAPPDDFTNFQMYATYLDMTMQQNHVKRLLNNTKKAEILKIMLETGQVDLLRNRASHLLEKLQISPFRKLKFSSKLYFDKNDAQLVRKLKNKFGSNTTLILGN